ncbi:hypothetical protein [Streptomyces minutiscleroticus]|uniref:hypothetical protein n=1 Tax=Streptomyces minutiscleroticus TaxID=68238 RepID=UPI003321F306
MTAALIGPANVLVAGFDPVEFLYRVTEHCMDLLGISDAGVVLPPPGSTGEQPGKSGPKE